MLSCCRCLQLIHHASQVAGILPETMAESVPPGESTESALEKFIRKSTAEPLVPIGAAVTIGFLVRGLKAFHAGQSNTSQMMMRGRIAAQAFTVGALILGTYAGMKPHERPQSMEEKLNRMSPTDDKGR